MAMQSMTLDPNAGDYSPDEIVAMVNAASAQITRTDSVAPAARPLGSKEVAAANIADGTVTNAQVAAGAAKANLDAMTDVTRGYIKTAPVTGQFKVISIERDATGKLKSDYDDVAVT